MTKDLTKGSPMKLILSFGIPLLLGYLFQQLYNVVDTAIVGKTLGGAALAAVGATGSINFLVVGFCAGICGGFAIPVAQQFGAGDHKELRRYVTGGVWLCVLFGAALTASTVLFCRNILTAMNPPADIYERSYLYIVTIFAGLPAYFLYNFVAGVLRAMGDSRTPVIWLIVASLVNIVLDVVFILTFHMDVFGAAFATVLSQFLAGVGCLIRMCRGFPILKMEREDWRWEGKRMGELCLMGLPMGLQYSITAIGSIVLQSAVNTLGSTYVAAVAAGAKLFQLLGCPYDAMGATMATYCGQNVGAVKLDRLGKGVRACSLLGLIYALIAFGGMLLFAPQGAMLFLDPTEPELATLVDLTAQYIRTLTAFFFPLALVNIVRFSIQGMGFSGLAILAGVMEMIARTAVGVIFVPMFGYTAACFASPAAWVCADLFLIPACMGSINRLRKIYEIEPEA